MNLTRVYGFNFRPTFEGMDDFNPRTFKEWDMSRNPRNYTLNIAFKCIARISARMRAMMVIPRGWCTFALLLACFFLNNERLRKKELWLVTLISSGSSVSAKVCKHWLAWILVTCPLLCLYVKSGKKRQFYTSRGIISRSHCVPYLVTAVPGCPFPDHEWIYS